MEGLHGKAEELRPEYDKMPHGGEKMRGLDLDTQSDVSRRIAAHHCLRRKFIEFSASLESENGRD